MRGSASRLAGLEDLVRLVVAVPGVHRADDRELVEHRRLLRQVLAEQDAGQPGGDDAERAAVLERAVGLGVPGVDLAGAAGHPEQDDGLASPDRPARLGGAGPVAEQVRQAQPGQARQAGLEQLRRLATTSPPAPAGLRSAKACRWSCLRRRSVSIIRSRTRPEIQVHELPTDDNGRRRRGQAPDSAAPVVQALARAGPAPIVASGQLGIRPMPGNAAMVKEEAVLSLGGESPARRHHEMHRGADTLTHHLDLHGRLFSLRLARRRKRDSRRHRILSSCVKLAFRHEWPEGSSPSELAPRRSPSC